VKKNGKKANGIQNFYCHGCRKQFQYAYRYKGADPRIKRQVCCMTLNGSGIRDIHRVLGVSIVGIIWMLRAWFKKMEEPVVSGHIKRVEIDEMWTFVRHRKAGKRWLWYAYDPDSQQIIAFHIGKRNDKACKALMKKLSHLTIDSYYTDNWKPYKKHIPAEKHIIAKAKTTHIERRNRDFRTHIKRLCRETVCFSKKDDMHYGIIKTYIFIKNAFGSPPKAQHTF
jgi:insertion element IS1 protein InsB